MVQQPFKIVENSQSQMPCNIEAEQAVIGSILVSNEIFDEIMPILDSQKFFDPIHIKLFEINDFRPSLLFKSIGVILNLHILFM